MIDQYISPDGTIRLKVEDNVWLSSGGVGWTPGRVLGFRVNRNDEMIVKVGYEPCYRAACGFAKANADRTKCVRATATKWAATSRRRGVRSDANGALNADRSRRHCPATVMNKAIQAVARGGRHESLPPRNEHRMGRQRSGSRRLDCGGRIRGGTDCNDYSYERRLNEFNLLE